MAKLQARQAERESLVTAVAAADALQQVRIDRPAIERKVLAQMGAWRDLLKSNARQLLREALDGPIRFTPNGTSPF